MTVLLLETVCGYICLLNCFKYELEFALPSDGDFLNIEI